MNNSNELYNILNDCLERLLTIHEEVEQCLRIMSEAVEQCLANYPEQAAHLKPLLETALGIKRALSAIQPRPEFRARARHQFHAALQGETARRGDLSSGEKIT